MKKLCALVSVFLLICTLLCACKAQAPDTPETTTTTAAAENSLVGSWTCIANDETISLVLNEDNTGMLAIGVIIGYDLTYTAEDGKITFEAENDIFQGKPLDYVLDGDNLTLSNEEEYLEFTREKL